MSEKEIKTCLNYKCSCNSIDAVLNCVLPREDMFGCLDHFDKIEEIKTCDDCSLDNCQECIDCKWNPIELKDNHTPQKEEYYNFSISVKEAEESSLMLKVFNIPPISMKQALENLQKPSTRKTTMTIEIEKREKK